MAEPEPGLEAAPPPKVTAPGVTLRQLKAGMKTIDQLTAISFDPDAELSEEGLAALWRLGAYIHYAVTSVLASRSEGVSLDTGEIKKILPGT